MFRPLPFLIALPPPAAAPRCRGRVCTNTMRAPPQVGGLFSHLLLRSLLAGTIPIPPACCLARPPVYRTTQPDQGLEAWGSFPLPAPGNSQHDAASELLRLRSPSASL